MLQEYSENEQANADPADPPVRSINAYLQTPLDRIQKYKALLKVTAWIKQLLYALIL